MGVACTNYVPTVRFVKTSIRVPKRINVMLDYAKVRHGKVWLVQWLNFTPLALWTTVWEWRTVWRYRSLNPALYLLNRLGRAQGSY
jgi:hypothetical protein